MRPDPPDLPSRLEPAARLEGDTSEALVEDAAQPGLRITALRIDGSRLVRCDLGGARLRNLDVRDSELAGCSLANADLGAARLRRVHITGARLTGLVWTGGDGGDVALADCRADLAALAGTTLERVRFTSCVLTQADFQGARLRTVLFEDCDLSEADFTGTRFEGVELRGCRIDGIRGAAGLRGVAMPWEDVLGAAAVFAQACGVRILERE